MCDNRGDVQISLSKPFWKWHIKQHIYEIASPKKLTNDRIEDNYRLYAYILLHELLHSRFGG
jgi:hypothetical protein